MSIQLYRLDESASFPSAELALEEPNGLLAFGGDLSVPRLLNAYRNGIFPWFSEGEPLLWWSPNPRGILYLEQYQCSRSLRKLLNKQLYNVTINKAFESVILNCAQVPRTDKGTWITNEMVEAYLKLNHAGYAHSIEVWNQTKLVGGLYGIGLGNVFCGESMFHIEANCSKLAFYYLVQHMKEHNCKFIDCQMQTPHLASMGATEVDREFFLALLKQQLSVPHASNMWQAQTLV